MTDISTTAGFTPKPALFLWGFSPLNRGYSIGMASAGENTANFHNIRFPESVVVKTNKGKLASLTFY